MGKGVLMTEEMQIFLGYTRKSGYMLYHAKANKLHYVARTLLIDGSNRVEVINPSEVSSTYEHIGVAYAEDAQTYTSYAMALFAKHGVSTRTAAKAVIISEEETSGKSRFIDYEEKIMAKEELMKGIYFPARGRRK